MLKEQEIFEKQERAKRLVQARKAAGFTGPKALEQAFPKWNINNYKAHESSRNGFGLADAKRYAKAFKVSAAWLMAGEGEGPKDKGADPAEESVRSLKSALIAYGVDHTQVGLVIEIIGRFVAHAPAEEQSEQIQTGDQSQLSSHRREATP